MRSKDNLKHYRGIKLSCISVLFRWPTFTHSITAHTGQPATWLFTTTACDFFLQASEVNEGMHPGLRNKAIYSVIFPSRTAEHLDS